MGVSLKERLRNGEVVLGFAVTYPAAGIVESIGKEWDWIWIDGQHGQMDYRTQLECVRTAASVSRLTVVRVPGHEYGIIGPVMDMAPDGIMVPMVDTADQAGGVVQAVRFPPVGNRSYGGRRVIDVGGRDYCKRAAEECALVVQIETPEAVDNVEAIAATEGVDVLFVGAADMRLRLGIDMGTPITESGELADAMAKTAQAAAKAGKFCGCVAMTPDLLKMAVSLGYQLIGGGGDIAFLRESSPERLGRLREALHNVK